MLNLIRSLLFAALAFVSTRRQLAIEVFALRQQLGVLKRSVKRPRLTNADRGLWVLLSRRWSSWSDALIIVKPAIVIRWHRPGYARCAGMCGNTTTCAALICRWAGTLRSPERWSLRRRGTSSSSQWSAVCTIGTRGEQRGFCSIGAG